MGPTDSYVWAIAKIHRFTYSCDVALMQAINIFLSQSKIVSGVGSVCYVTFFYPETHYQATTPRAVSVPVTYS